MDMQNLGGQGVIIAAGVEEEELLPWLKVLTHSSRRKAAQLILI